MGVWLTKEPTYDPQSLGLEAERGRYIVFNPKVWQKESVSLRRPARKCFCSRAPAERHDPLLCGFGYSPAESARRRCAVLSEYPSARHCKPSRRCSDIRSLTASCLREMFRTALGLTCPLTAHRALCASTTYQNHELLVCAIHCRLPSLEGDAALYRLSGGSSEAAGHG